ncbi:MAG TPA: TRAP transporter small permease subunit [Gammaproteobacteria bacterium]|nr:TRAP transporter small permease subunit [Gammaproteobacteria bacterium]
MMALTELIEALSESIGRAVSWLTLGMVLALVVVVVLRYGFGIGAVALQEAALYMHALVFLLGAAYTLRHGEHVRVDVFYRDWPVRRRAAVDLAGALLLLIPVCALIFWSSLDYVAAAWRVREGSREAGGLPWLYLLKTVIPVAAVLLALQGCVQAWRAWRTLRERTEA